MVESSDLQGAIQRTQAMERVQALQAQQEEMNKRRFELEIERQRAETGKKVQESKKSEGKRVTRDRWDGEGNPEGGTADEHGANESDPESGGERPDEEPPEGGGHIDVRV